LILENELFRWGYFTNFDLISDCDRNRKDDFHTREFTTIFEFHNDIFAKLILDFHNWGIKLYDIRSIEFRLSLLKGFEDILVNFINKSEHTLLDFETIDGVVYFFAIKP